MPDHPPRLSGAASSARGGSLAKSGGEGGEGTRCATELYSSEGIPD